MLSLGLSTADLQLYQASLISNHAMAVTIQILNLNHGTIMDASDMFIDGQVNKDFWEMINSGASLTLRDPDGLTGFDTLSPSDGALYADRMLRITYSVWSELLPRWVHCPLFTGPVTKVNRDDAILSVECQGKETLYMPPSMAWYAKTYPKATKLTAALRELLGTRGGEKYFDFPEWTTTLPKDYALATKTAAWDAAQWMSGSKNTRQLFYDGRGTLRLRSRSSVPSFTITEDHLLSVPKLDYDTETTRNTVLVEGGTPTGKPQIKAIRYLPAAHGSSRESLAINGKPRHLVELVEDTALMTQAAADSVAATTLSSVQIGSTGFDFDMLPIPHLEPGDTVHLNTRDISINILADKFSIPLKVGPPQSMGDHRRISANVARLRRR